jgi:4-hydroxy-3-polyprenylbenzoate decarboxylase
MEQHWARGDAAPVAVVCGADPTLLLSSGQLLPWGLSEYDFAGWLRGEPVAVVSSPRYHLPIPATAEIVLEGRVPPPEQVSHLEGPFAEFTGYYASDSRPEPVMQVEAVSYRDDPILLGSPPFRPTGESGGLPMRAALIWNALDAAGVTDVRGVYRLEPGGSTLLTVISLKQAYAGHAKQAALASLGSRAGGYLSRYVILVDEDIDPSDQGEVLWAIATRCDPETSIDVVRNCWGTALDPRLTPEKRARRDFGVSVGIIDATRPFHWRDQFPLVNAISQELRAELLAKWAHLFS